MVTNFANRADDWDPPEPTSSWPLLLLLWGLPFLWLTGLRIVGVVACAVLLAVIGLASFTRLRVPRGFAVWLIFMGATFASAFMLSSPDRMVAWTYRQSMYIAATIILLFVINQMPSLRFDRKLAVGMLALWYFMISAGVAGLIWPDITLSSPLLTALPTAISNNQFLVDQITPRLSATDSFLDVTRPIAPFAYTNEWGAVMAISTLLAMYSFSKLRSSRARTIFWTMSVVSIIPITISVNRGLWISLGAGLLAVAVQQMLRRRVGMSLGILGGSLVALLMVAFTPLGKIVSDRLDRPNVGTRETLVSASIDAFVRQPLLGYGAPLTGENIADANGVSVGTHGQLWTLLVSYGSIATLAWFVFFLILIVRCSRVRGAEIWAWGALVAFVVQAPFYDALPFPLILSFLAVGVCLRKMQRPLTPVRTNVPTTTAARADVPRVRLPNGEAR